MALSNLKFTRGTDVAELIIRNYGTSELSVVLKGYDNKFTTLEGDKVTEGSIRNLIDTLAKDAQYATVEVPEVLYTETDQEVIDGTAHVGDVKVPATTKNLTIAEAIAALESKTAEGTEALRTDINQNAADIDAVEGRLDILEGDVTTEGSVKKYINDLAGDGTFTFAGADTATTIKAAIQANADAIIANKTGSFKVISSIDEIALDETGVGIIYLVSHDGEPNEAGNAVATHYDEYIVIKIDDVYSAEKIGDTEISLDGYATQNWVIANAKDAIYSEAVGEVDTPEYVPAVTLAQAIANEIARSTAADAEMAAYVGKASVKDDEGNVTEAATGLTAKVEANESAIKAEVERATLAETGLKDRIDVLESGVEVEGSVLKSIHDTAKDGIYTPATDAVTHEVTAEDDVTSPESPYYGKTVGEVVIITPAKDAVTIEGAIKALETKTGESTDALRADLEAKIQEEANARDLADKAINDSIGAWTDETVTATVKEAIEELQAKVTEKKVYDYVGGPNIVKTGHKVKTADGEFEVFEATGALNAWTNFAFDGYTILGLVQGDATVVEADEDSNVIEYEINNGFAFNKTTSEVVPNKMIIDVTQISPKYYDILFYGTKE